MGTFADPVNKFTTIRAPYPSPKVTMTLPKPLFDDSRANQTRVIVKRNMLGDPITYTNSSDKIVLTLPFSVTRQKSLEIQEFTRVYQSAHWGVTLYDGSDWDCQLTRAPFVRVADSRIGGGRPDLTGTEQMLLTLEFSALRIQ